MNHARYVDRNYSGQRSGDGSDAADAGGAPDAPDAAIRRLAERQYGIVTCGQLRGLGLTQDAIAYRLRVGRLCAVRRAVYAVGHRQATTEARWMAAVLAGGPEAVLSHHSAGERWGVIEGARTPVDLTVPRPRRPARGIRYHRSVLARDEVTRSDGIPVTSFPRTLFDLAAVLRPRQLERALNEGEIRRHWDTLSLEELLVRYPRRHGSRAIRGLLESRRSGMRITRNEFEVRLLELVDAAGLPEPQTNQPIEGLEVDCVWRQHGLIVELDGYETHSTRAAFERDRQRSRILQAAGWRNLQVTWRQLRDAPEAMMRDIRRILTAAPRAGAACTVAPGSPGHAQRTRDV